MKAERLDLAYHVHLLTWNSCIPRKKELTLLFQYFWRALYTMEGAVPTLATPALLTLFEQLRVKRQVKIWEMKTDTIVVQQAVQ